MYIDAIYVLFRYFFVSISIKVVVYDSFRVTHRNIETSKESLI